MKKIISIIFLYVIFINQAFAGIYFYSVMPNTSDDKNLEFIKLYNSGTGKINLKGYQIKDKSNKIFTFGSGEFIEVNSIETYYRSQTKILLNNTNEELYLYDSSGNLIDSFSYSNSTKGKEILIYSGSLSSSGALINPGNTTQSGATNQSTQPGSITDSGNLNTGSGNLINSGNLSNSGFLTNSGNTTQSGITNTNNTQSGSTNSGNLVNSGNLNGNTNFGNLNQSGSLTNSGISNNINNSGSLNIGSGSLSNSGNINSQINLNSGALSQTGNLINSGSLSNSGTLTNSGSISQSGTTNLNTSSGNTTNSGSTNSGNITKSGATNQNTQSGSSLPNIIIEFQNPSYILDKTAQKSKYICDNSKDKCKINLNLEKSFSGSIKKSNYICKIDFGLEGWTTGEENKCNPNTIIFPKGTFNIKIRIISKDNPSLFSQKSFTLENKIEPQIKEVEKIVYQEKVCSSNSTSNSSSSSTNSSHITPQSEQNNHPQINIQTPKIKIQSGIKNGKCTKTDCSVNLIYTPKHKNEVCLWNFGNGTFRTTGTDKKCNPGYVKYPLGTHTISLKVYDKYHPNNYKISYLNFKNIIPSKTQKNTNTPQEENKTNEPNINNKETTQKTSSGNTAKLKNSTNTSSSLVNTNSGGLSKINTNISNKKSNSLTNIQSKKINSNTKKEIKTKQTTTSNNLLLTKSKEKPNLIQIQGKIGKNKVLNGKNITCIDKCSVNFTAKKSDDVVEYIWDFGNGKTFEGENPPYIKYKKFGKYLVSLTATTKFGEKYTEKFLVEYKPKQKKIKNKTPKQKLTKSKKQEKNGIFLSKQKLENDYILKKDLNKSYVKKDNIGSYCLDSSNFPKIVLQLKVLVFVLIGILASLMVFVILKEKKVI